MKSKLFNEISFYTGCSDEFVEKILDHSCHDSIVSVRKRNRSTNLES